MGAKASKKKQQATASPAKEVKSNDAAQKSANEEASKKAEAAKPVAEEKKAEETKPAAGSASSASKYEDFLNKLEKVKKENPENRCAKYLSRELFLSYTPAQQDILYRCALSGVENPDVGFRIDYRIAREELTTSNSRDWVLMLCDQTTTESSPNSSTR